MEKNYTTKEIDRFFKTFKELPVSYELDKVHHLINHPEGLARPQGKSQFQPLKFVIMSSSIIISIASVIFWFTHVITDKTNPPANTQSIVAATKSTTDRDDHQMNIKSSNPFIKAQTLNFSGTTGNDPFNDSLNWINQTTQTNGLVYSWSKDTSINGDHFVATLSDAELEKLGFQLTSKGVFYKNEWEGKPTFFHSIKDSSSSDVSHNLEYASPLNKKTTLSHFGFYPVLISSNVYSPWNGKCEKFSLMNDTLFPVIIKHAQLKNENDDLILWFTVTPSLFEQLPYRYRKFENEYVQIKELKRQDPDKDIVVYQPKKITDGLHFIELSKPELEKLGFEIKEENIYFSISDIKKDSMRFFITHNGMGVEFGDSIYALKKKLNIVYLTNEYGEKRIQWKSKNDPDDKNTIEKIIENSQYLIPVLLNKEDYPRILDENEIFWFRPSEAFFDSLPERYKEPIKSEYHYLTANSREIKNLSTSCTFFEECKSTLQLNRLKVYPNPASHAIQVEFDIDEPVSGRIVLVNISGSQIKELAPETKWQKGINSFQMDVSDVVSGIYLLTIKTNKGFKTQRIIVAH